MRKTFRNGSLPAGIFLILLLAAGAAAQEKKTPDASSSPLFEEAKNAIAKGNQQWVEAFEKGNAEGVASIFAEDGMWLGGNGKVNKGPMLTERVKAYMKYYGAGVKLTVTSTKIWVDGETAYESGKYVYQYQKDGKPATDEGRYATIWKRQKDGAWKLYLDMPVM